MVNLHLRFDEGRGTCSVSSYSTTETAQNQIRKEPWSAGRFVSRPGSSLDENMLMCRYYSR